MIKVALSFLLGVLVFQTSRTLPDLYYLIFIPILCGLWLKFPRSLPLLIALLGYSWTHIFAHHYLHPQLAPELQGEDISIKGIIEEVSILNHRYGKFILHVSQETIDKFNNRVPRKLQLSWYQPKQTIREKQICNLTVRLKKHWRYANPGGQDYELMMFLKKIGARGYVRQGTCAQLDTRLNFSVQLRQQWLDEFLNKSRGYDYSHLMQALTFGYRENIEQSQWQVLRKTGTTHLLAISGLHLSAVAFVVFVCVNRLCRFSARLCDHYPAQQVSALFAIAFTLFYAYLAGFSLPTQRALIMVTVSLSAILLYRSAINTSVLASALLLVLIFNPLVVLSAGFWMSFLAVLFIYFALKASAAYSKIIRIIFIQFFLGLALFPISLLFFSEASIISPLVNLVAIPIVSFLILPVLLFSQSALLLGLPYVDQLFSFIDYLFHYLWWLLQWCAQVKFASWQFVPTIYGVIIFELGLLILVFSKGIPIKHLALCLMAGMFLLKPPALKPKQMRVTVFDVGQGLAVVIETASYTLLYDAGMQSLSGFNMGQVVVEPYLRWRDIREVDLAVISHNDNDHAGGMRWLLENQSIHQLMVSNQPDLYQHTNSMLCRSGDIWQKDSVIFKVLHPPEMWQSNNNNRSCVLQIIHPAGTILLTGDIESRAEARLIDQYSDNLASELMTAPHHGSKSSSSYRFVDHVHPQTVVFSAGYRNRYGFPHATIRQRYEDLGVRSVDTIRQGAVTFLFESGSDSELAIQRQTGYRITNRRYWHATLGK